MVHQCLQGDISVLVFFSCVEGVMAELHRNGNWWSETQAQCMVISHSGIPVAKISKINRCGFETLPLTYVTCRSDLSHNHTVYTLVSTIIAYFVTIAHLLQLRKTQLIIISFLTL